MTGAQAAALALGVTGAALLGYGIWKATTSTPNEMRARVRNPRRVQWQRVDYAGAPQGHALTATVGGQSWRTYERSDGQWSLEPIWPKGQSFVVGSLQEARDLAEG